MWMAARKPQDEVMTDNGLPCIDLLEATPEILRGVMTELTEEDARWKPAPDRFSIAEVLAHLSHSEGHCYRMRLDRFLAETRPEFEPDDAQMYLELYKDADPEDAFDRFEEQRESNVEYLRGLPAGAGYRVALHRDCLLYTSPSPRDRQKNRMPSSA